MSVLAACAAVCGTVVAGVADARTGYIPNRVPVVTAMIGGLLSACEGMPALAVLGGLATGGGMWSLYALTRGRGLGLGDVKLAVAIGVGLGPTAGMLALAAAFVLGAVYGAWLLASGRARRRDAIRFGPFLAAGTFAAALNPAGFGS